LIDINKHEAGFPNVHTDDSLNMLSKNIISIKLYDRRTGHQRAYFANEKTSKVQQLTPQELKECSEACFYLPQLPSSLDKSTEEIKGERRDPLDFLPKRVFFYLLSHTHYSTITNSFLVSKKWNQTLKGGVWEAQLNMLFPWVKVEQGKEKETYMELVERTWNPKPSLSMQGVKYICVPQRVNGFSILRKIPEDTIAITIGYSGAYLVMTAAQYSGHSVDTAFKVVQYLRGSGF